MSTIEEPTPARPWRPADGAPPTVWTWPSNDRPALEVWSAGAWRYASVAARQDWPDGTVRYQVLVDLRGDTTSTHRTYAWPQPGLRKRHGSHSEPSQGVDEGRQGEMPRRAPTGR
ncbi:hypothetical protein ACIBAC_00735 [Streptomyces sp. NPDC051362]|uniref:hypothetical protein n=1 Tax=Streptomyces sp. NPDC051362 TaxID=3365651 RepID=UPI0037B0ED5E